MQLRDGTDPIDVKISSQISDLKPLHASWIVDLYHYLEEEKQMIKNGFQVPGISEAVNKVWELFQRVSFTPSHHVFYTVNLSQHRSKTCRFALLMAFIKEV